MKFSFKAIPLTYYGAIAATILLLAWTIDNLVNKRIAATRNVLDKFNSAQLQANYQRSTLHYLADIRSILNELTPDFPKDTKFDNTTPMEFQNLNSGRLKLATDATLRMQDFALAGKIQAGIFDEVDLPKDTRENLNKAVNGWQNYTSTLSIKLGEINDFARDVMLLKYGGKPRSFEQLRQSNQTNSETPSQEDILKLDKLFDEFWDLHRNGFNGGEWESRLNNATNKAAAYVYHQQKEMELVSKIISIAYLTLFVLGSILSIIAAINRGKSG